MSGWASPHIKSEDTIPECVVIASSLKNFGYDYIHLNANFMCNILKIKVAMQ